MARAKKIGKREEGAPLRISLGGSEELGSDYNWSSEWNGMDRVSQPSCREAGDSTRQVPLAFWHPGSPQGGPETLLKKPQ